MLCSHPIRILAITGDLLYFQRDSAIECAYAHDMGKTTLSIDFSAYYPVVSSDLLSRALRAGVLSLLPIKGDALILNMRKMVISYDYAIKSFGQPFIIPQGKRFLVLCSDKENRIYCGEYCSNKERGAINIFCSNDKGRSFDVFYTFPMNTIRHVHGVFYDPYDDLIWITTGDTNDEVGIWVNDGSLINFKKVLGGNQQARAIQLLFTNHYVYFGSDSPLERNFIYRLDKKTGEVDKLQEVDGSVFWGCKVGDYLFFSTAVEPSKVNKCKDACIWGSKDGETWKCISRYRKDIWPMKLFQYGQIFFPTGENNTDYLWFTPFATEKHLTIQRLDIKEMF